jgi:hypothetical protein
MKEHQTVQVATGGQIKELASALVEAILSNIMADKAQYWIGKKKKLANEVRKILVRVNGNKSEHSELLLDWQNFWKGINGKEHDFSNIRIPEKPAESNWRLLVIVDILLGTLYAKFKERFDCWRWTDDNFDKIVAYNERDAKSGPYAIWIRDEEEADEKYKNLSVNQIKGMNIKTETLAERFIHELKYFQETGKHLDIKNITLCSGSRDGDDYVPIVDWDYDGFRVDWCDLGGRGGHLRVREAVS